MNHRIIGIVMVSALAALVGCKTVTWAPKPEAGKAVPANSIVVAGRVILDPEPQQKFGGLGIGIKEAFEHRFLAQLLRQPAQKFEELTGADFTIGEMWNDYFVAILPRESLNWVTVLVRIEQEGGHTIDLFLNSPFQIAYQPNDRFVYLGDFIYHLNVKNELGGNESVLEVRDGYAAAKKKLEGTVQGEDGKALILEKRLPQNIAKLKADVIETTYKTVYY